MIRICFGVALLLSNLINAQNNLHGFIKDDNGLPYQHLVVRIEQTEQSTTTDDSGYYLIKDIIPGTYALSIDYLYDIKYFTVTVSSGDTSFDIVLTRRIEFNEILVRGYQMDVSRYSNAIRFNAEQLQALQKEKDLPYVLRNVSGIIVQSDSGNGIGYTGMRMRGMDPSHVQININGIPFNDCESSLSYFVDIPDIISSTQEITVIKGNVPNRAGTPSFGGAIDINTNKLIFDPFLQVNSQLGSFNSWKYSIQANSGLVENKYNFEFGFSRQKSDGYINRSGSDLKSFRFSAAIIEKKYSSRLNYIHGNEITGQAWNGLPIQYEGIDSLRRYNSAGTEKTGDPYSDEKDNYKQDHIQYFYQNQLTNKIALNASLNYTHGSGYFENYKQNQVLSNYYIKSTMAINADLIKRQWLDNDFIFANAALQIQSNNKLTFVPSVSWSNYNGNHYGRVNWVNLGEYSFLRNRYYENQGIKKEYSACIKSIYKVSDKFNLSLDLQFRYLEDKIDGKLEFQDSLLINKKYQLFNSKIFAEYSLNRNLHFFSSLGFMEREPFREDLIGAGGALKPEDLLDLEVGLKYNAKNLSIKLNGYLMDYKQQLALSGKLNNVGEALHINLDKSYRLGFELESEYNILNWLSIWNASNLSLNKIPKIIEYIPDYTGSQEVQYKEIVHSNATISFSPSQVIHSGIKIVFVKERKRNPELEFHINHYYVSNYNLDNYNQASSILKGYENLECTFFIKKTYPKLGAFNFWIAVYNILDAKYYSHGWISSRFISIAPDPDPYLKSDSNAQNTQTYYYKGLFPQALRHFNLGLSLNFL